MRVILTILVMILLPLPAIAHEAGSHGHQPPWQAATSWPDRIVVTLKDDPAHSFSVAWRTDNTVSVPLVQIAPANSDARFDLQAETFAGETESLDLSRVELPGGEWTTLYNVGLPTVHYHTYTFSGLQPDTLYAYRVRGGEGQWSAWRQVRTAPLSGPLDFIFFGDTQTGIRSHITRIFDMARQTVPDARFAIHGGDLVNNAMHDRQWAEWNEAIGNTHQILPAIPVAGNHDYINNNDMKLFASEDKIISPLWRNQFNLPSVDTLADDLNETVYDIRYTRDLHVFVLDSSGIDFEAQVRWLEEEATASDARWKVVSMHHPLYSEIGEYEHPSHKQRREIFHELMRKGLIDIVVTGHRHSYQRGNFGDDVARYNIGTPHGVETVFIITASSTKRGETKVEGWKRFSGEQDGEFSLVRYADRTPLFAAFRLEGNQLSYRAIDAVGEVYDSFTLTKDESGAKTIRNGPAAQGAVKDVRQNTGEYRGWTDLR